MSDPRHFSTKTMRDAYKRSQGRCENPSCRIPFPAGGGGVEYDHIINWWLSRDSSLENCQCLCADCHLKKTAGYDIPVIRKCERIADRRMGIKRRRNGKKFSCGKDSDWSKTLAGPVVRRVKGRGAKDRAVIARRQILGAE